MKGVWTGPGRGAMRRKRKERRLTAAKCGEGRSRSQVLPPDLCAAWDWGIPWCGPQFTHLVIGRVRSGDPSAPLF
jgi:hypothetical protein